MVLISEADFDSSNFKRRRLMAGKGARQKAFSFTGKREIPAIRRDFWVLGL
ncbi:hypothetical protein [Deinococcus misasensis]|uniref:hypothetical protein n=1 Tax=Deinococcus misasensis TaxID=392413 RepID=UPI0012FC9E9C|nr:hypothetical protein [Deinococcus misasensis]